MEWNRYKWLGDSGAALGRETELENELSRAAEDINKQRGANRSLEMTIKELQGKCAEIHDI